MYFFKKAVLFIFFCLACSGADGLFACEGPLDEEKRGIQALSKDLEAFLENSDVPLSGALLIAKADKVLFEAAMGEGEDISLSSQFLMGSISKQVTAVLILRSGLDVYAPIVSYIPQLTQGWAHHVTLHHLLSHSSGLITLEEPLAFVPGEGFLYSNDGYDLAGYVLGMAMGKPYNLLANELFERLNMQDSCAPDWEEGLVPPRLVKGYVSDAQGKRSLCQGVCKTASNPSVSLVSTVHDLLKWHQALHGGDLLPPQSYTQMTTPVQRRQHRWGNVGYGYGVHLSLDDTIREIHHNGMIPGYLGTQIYYPDSQISILILENHILWTGEWDMETQMRVCFVHDGIRRMVQTSSLF